MWCRMREECGITPFIGISVLFVSCKDKFVRRMKSRNNYHSLSV